MRKRLIGAENQCIRRSDFDLAGQQAPLRWQLVLSHSQGFRTGRAAFAVQHLGGWSSRAGTDQRADFSTFFLTRVKLVSFAAKTLSHRRQGSPRSPVRLMWDLATPLICCRSRRVGLRWG